VSMDSCYLCYGPALSGVLFLDRGWDLNLPLLTSYSIYQIDSIGGRPHQRANITRFSIRPHQSRTEREIPRFLQIYIYIYLWKCIDSRRSICGT
jgi:hypothetical protein